MTSKNEIEARAAIGITLALRKKGYKCGTTIPQLTHKEIESISRDFHVAMPVIAAAMRKRTPKIHAVVERR